MTTKPYKMRKKTVRRHEQREYPFYPHQLFRNLMAVMGAVAVVAVLAALFPLPMDRMADPLAQPDPGVGTLWILKPAILLAGILARPALAVGLIFILAVLFVLLPILDRSGHSSLKRRVLIAIPFLLWMVFLAVSLLIPTGVAG